MIVYHGTTEIVRNPDVDHSYRQLDFGKGSKRQGVSGGEYVSCRYLGQGACP